MTVEDLAEVVGREKDLEEAIFGGKAMLGGEKDLEEVICLGQAMLGGEKDLWEAKMSDQLKINN